MGIEMSVTEFKAKCLELFGKISRNEIDVISVTKRGKMVGLVTPPNLTREEAYALYNKWQASMKGRAVALDPDFDLTKPHIVEFDPEIENLR